MNVRSLITFTDLLLISFVYENGKKYKQNDRDRRHIGVSLLKLLIKTFFFIHMLSWVGVSQ